MPQSQSNGFGAAGNPQLGKDVTDVGFNRGWADRKPASDLGIIQAFHHQGEHFPFTFGQVKARFGALDLLFERLPGQHPAIRWHVPHGLLGWPGRVQPQKHPSINTL